MFSNPSCAVDCVHWEVVAQKSGISGNDFLLALRDITVLVMWCVGGFGTFHAWLNSFIHFVMYIYYALSALGPRYQKYLWWKKYMTSMQIVSASVLFEYC